MIEAPAPEAFTPTGMGSPPSRNPLLDATPPPELPTHPVPHEPAYGELKVTVPMATQGNVIGLNLSEDDLVILSFADPAAERYGFKIGDKMLAVNGMNVNSEDEFLMRLKGARSRNATFGEPIVFTVFRGGVPPQDPTEWLGTWEYREGSGGGNRYQYKIKRDQTQIVFEQEIPDGVVSGVLMPGQANTAEAQLHLKGGEFYGSVQFRLAEQGVLLSQLKLEGSPNFGAEIAAKKVAGPSHRKKKGGCVC